jgi:hypothetical protein
MLDHGNDIAALGAATIEEALLDVDRETVLAAARQAWSDPLGASDPFEVRAKILGGLQYVRVARLLSPGVPCALIAYLRGVRHEPIPSIRAANQIAFEKASNPSSSKSVV